MTEIKTFDAVLPAAPGRCPQCATDHPPEQPHDMTLFYKYAFHQQHQRWPTWNDAMSHCSPEMQDVWRKALWEIGIDVPESAL